MEHSGFFFTICVIYTGAALLSTLVLFTRQSLLVAYILLGVILGPWGLKLVHDVNVVHQIGEVGITFLLFLLGLDLKPKNLVQMLRRMTLVSLLSSALFVAIAYAVSRAYGFSHLESLVVGAALMFSSTIIGLKLLPTTMLHHQHTGEVMISVLLIQDFIAIAVLLLLQGATDGFSVGDVGKVVVALPGLMLLAYLIEHYVLEKLLARFDQIQEYVFLLAIGWCLGFAELGSYLKVSSEIGAFIAGVALASSPISQHIAQTLKPLRDFFLVMFFFAMGAGFDLAYLDKILVPALLMAGLMLVLKPYIYYGLLRSSGEQDSVAMEVGVRLGQASEFSILVASIASISLIRDVANYLILTTTIITFIASSYIVVLRYPTPLGLTERMRKD